MCARLVWSKRISRSTIYPIPKSNKCHGEVLTTRLRSLRHGQRKRSSRAILGTDRTSCEIQAAVAL